VLVPVLQIGNGQYLALIDHTGYAHPDGDRCLVQRVDQGGNGVEHLDGTTGRGVGLCSGVNLVVGRDQAHLDVGAAHVDTGDKQVLTHLCTLIM